MSVLTDFPKRILAFCCGGARREILGDLTIVDFLRVRGLMVGFVIAGHGRLAEEFLSTATQIVGEIAKAATCSVVPGASLEDIRQTLARAIRSVDDELGVILFADLVGGSPCTQGLTLCNNNKLEVVTGVNLPMILKAATLRSADSHIAARDLAQQLVQHGPKTITWPSEQLRATLG